MGESKSPGQRPAPRGQLTGSPIQLTALVLAAAGFALANGLWSIFLWRQLLVARAGGEPFCALGGGGCAVLWDGAFANQIHASTGLPVAAWGVVWSGAALALALWTVWRLRRGRSPEPVWSGAVLLAAAGALSIPVLLGASLLAGEFCSNCAIVYGLVAAHAGLVFVATGRLAPQGIRRGVGAAAGALGAVFLLALQPGLATPRSGAQLGADALAAVESRDPAQGLASRIDALSPQAKQLLANARARWIDATPIFPRPARALLGPADAPVRITTFTDSGCSHCAVFHKALEQLLQIVPPGSVAIEQRVFPLDGACNPLVPGTGHEELCLAAQVRVCLESDPRALELSGWLHEDAAPLDEESIYRVATRLAPRAPLEECVESERTASRIQADIEYGQQAGIAGTPFLVVNDRPAMAFAPFLYALIVAEGDADSRVFAGLPAPSSPPSEPGHEGHGH